mmetsp:Transcript_35928/g.72955  ORF Transcript_35928/g.72955 Transcript_35928/m.72955 type:complete len:98 (-) Transcript_35928:745-1038(-)
MAGTPAVPAASTSVRSTTSTASIQMLTRRSPRMIAMRDSAASTVTLTAIVRREGSTLAESAARRLVLNTTAAAMILSTWSKSSIKRIILGGSGPAID